LFVAHCYALSLQHLKKLKQLSEQDVDFDEIDWEKIKI